MGDVAQILSGAITQAQASGPTSTSNKKTKLAPPPLPPSHVIPKSLKQVSISRHPMAILTDSSHPEDLGSASLPPMVPTASFQTNPGDAMKKPGSGITAHNTKINKKYITLSSTRKAKPWTWAPFTSSARTDGLLLNHWVRAGVEYPDYPYARFNIHLQPLSYKEDTKSSNTRDLLDSMMSSSSSSSYEKLGLADDAHWTQSETDILLELCRIHELRWPVIIDRWICIFGNNTNKKVEDLQHRYLTIGMILNRRSVEQAAKNEVDSLTKAITANNNLSSVSGSNGLSSNEPMAFKGSSIPDNTLVAERALASAVVASAAYKHSNITATLQPPIAKLSTGTSNQMVFDLQAERRRRQYLEDQWNRSKEEEKEEADLLKELDMIDVQIKKLKKNGGHLLASTAVLNSAPNSSRPTPLSSRVPSPNTTMDEMNAFNFQLSTAPTPTAGTPYLQSGRIGHPGPDCGISKSILKRMDQVLKEMGIKERPLPTKRVCDLYDNVRRDMVALLTLQKIMLKTEAEVVSKRLKLDKLTGTNTQSTPGSGTTNTKSMPSSSMTKPSSSTMATKKTDDAPSTNTGKKAPSTKRKASPDSKSAPNPEETNIVKATSFPNNPADTKVKTKRVSGTKRKSSTKNAESAPPMIPTWNGFDPVNNPLPPPNDFISGSVASPLLAAPPKPMSVPMPVPIFNSGVPLQAVPTPIKFGNTFNSVMPSIPTNEGPNNKKPKKRAQKSSAPTVEKNAPHLKEA